MLMYFVTLMSCWRQPATDTGYLLHTNSKFYDNYGFVKSVNICRTFPCLSYFISDPGFSNFKFPMCITVQDTPWNLSFFFNFLLYVIYGSTRGLETRAHLERPRREDGQQHMDTQAHHVGPQRRQKERGATTDEMGWPVQKTCGRPMVQKCERQSVVERTWKNFKSIRLAHL